MSRYPILLVRFALGFVFLLFGADKFINPVYWESFIPVFFSDIITFSTTTFIHILGVIEIIFGVLLTIGLLTNIVSLLSAIHLFLVIISLGYNDIFVRDFALLLISISLFLIKDHPFSLDSFIKSKKNKSLKFL